MSPTVNHSHRTKLVNREGVHHFLSQVGARRHFIRVRRTRHGSVVLLEAIHLRLRRKGNGTEEGIEVVVEERTLSTDTLRVRRNQWARQRVEEWKRMDYRRPRSGPRCQLLNRMELRKLGKRYVIQYSNYCHLH